MLRLPRRSKLAAVAAISGLVSALNLASYAGTNAPAKPASDHDDTIRIGFVTSLTGVAHEASEDMKNAIELYMDQIHHKIAGKKVELIVENDESNPAMAKVKVMKLINQDHCQILDGLILGHIGYAVAPVVEKEQVPMVFAIAAGDDVTQRTPCKWVVRSGWNSSQPAHPFGEYVYKTLGYKKVVCLGMDYPFGWEVVGGFQKSFEEAGGKVIQKIWAPLGFQDFTDYVKQIDRNADALFILTSNIAAGIIPKELKAAGIKMPIIAGGTSYDESVLRHLGDEAIGVVSVAPYSAALNTPANKRFVAAYKAKYGKAPSWFAEGAYTSGMVIAKAIESVKGDVSDKAKLLNALKHVELKDAPRGPLKIDDYANPVQNIYVRRVEKVNGELQNTVVHTFPAIGQFWHWDAKEYLKQPVYTREFPPCKNCAK